MNRKKHLFFCIILAFLCIGNLIAAVVQPVFGQHWISWGCAAICGSGAAVNWIAFRKLSRK